MPDPDTTAAKTAVQTGADTVSSEYNPMDPSLGLAMSESLQHIVNNSANYNYTEERPDQLAREYPFHFSLLNPSIGGTRRRSALAWPVVQSMDLPLLPKRSYCRPRESLKLR